MLNHVHWNEVSGRSLSQRWKVEQVSSRDEFQAIEHRHSNDRVISTARFHEETLANGLQMTFYTTGTKIVVFDLKISYSAVLSIR